jgi:tRNA nucleotidyltransferase (CCA-adding enzyme)
MPLYNEIYAEVLEKIKPTQSEIESINSIIEKLKKLLDTKARELGIDYTTIEPQGSTGIKQTQLKNDFDIDLFVGLDYNAFQPNYKGLSKNKLKKESKKDFLELCSNWIIPSLTLEEFHNPRLLYAEHPYTTVEYRVDNIEVRIDIVLYFDIDLEVIKQKGPVTAVDRSPWHGRFIRDNLTEDQRNDVRLLKQFFKANNSYGDKSSVGRGGFIGYSSELLIYYYRTINDLFNDFDKLPSRSLDFYKRDMSILRKITHFQNDKLMIIDPIDKNRNVASAISEKAYYYCNHRIKEFLKNPRKDYFEVQDIPQADLGNFNDNLLKKIYLVELKNTSDDIHYTINRDKLYSLGDSIVANGEKEFTHAERFGKILFELYFEEVSQEYILVFYCNKPHISRTYTRKGPPISESFHASKFKKKNKDFFAKKGHLWVETKRDYNNFSLFLKNFVQSKLPDNFEVLNISKSFNAQTISGRKAITILRKMILPFYL